MASARVTPAQGSKRARPSATGELFELTLLHGRDAQTYQSMLERVRGALEPQDLIERFWLQNIVDLTWEMLELRRSKAQLMFLSAHRELMQFFSADLSIPLSPADAYTLQGLERVFKTVGLDGRGVMAKMLAIELSAIGQIERMSMETQARCDAILREMERRRTRYNRPAYRLSITLRYLLSNMLDEACAETTNAGGGHD